MATSKLPADFHVCIIGAGIVGTACAIALRREGFKVTVIEKDKILHTVGAGIELQPNAVRVLQDLGVLDEIRRIAVLTPALVLKEYTEGNVLHTQSVLEATQRYGFPCLSVHRAELRKTLYDKAAASGAQFIFDSLVQADGIDLGAGMLTFSQSKNQTGEETYSLHADLFIGANGANSSFRQTMLGQKVEWTPHGKVVNRLLIDKGLIQVQPDLRHLVEQQNCVVWLGPESQAVTYSVDGKLNVAFTRPWSADPKDAFFGSQKVDFEAFEAELAVEGWHVQLRRLVGLGRDTGCHRWMFFEPKIDDETAPWRDLSSKFCLVGDAAHWTLPYLAQGAAIGLESAAVLANLLGKARCHADLPDVLALYERQRKERAGHVIRASMRNGRMWQMPNGPLKDERDRQFLEEVPGAGYPNHLADPFFQSWLWSFDAAKDADEAWSTVAAEMSRERKCDV